MEMTRISVPVTIAEREELQADAQRQLRHPREHARYLLRRALGITEDQQVESTVKTQNAASGHIRQDLATSSVL